MQNDPVWTEATLTATRDLTPDIRLLEIAPVGGALAWDPGSHIDLAVDLNGRLDRRSYSLVGTADPAVYRIAVKRVAASRGGSSWLHGLLPGQRLQVSAPRNRFPLQHGAASYLLIAGGIGITPLLGMAEALLQRGADFRLLYAVRSRRDLAFADMLTTRLGDRLGLFVSDEANRMDLMREVAVLPAHADIYFCGPSRMLAGLQDVLAQLDRSSSSLRFETFGSGGLQPNEPFWVKVPRLGIEIAVPENSTMLDALEAAGVEVMSECRRGECGLCAVDVVAVEGGIDHRDVFLSEQQKRENHRLCACVSRAVHGGLVIDTAWRADQ
ncbi:PDR/VanB family oxidoreductase [Ferrovibrio sp.]|uniref:PDR/VanB family oxidoreductase n=1 Tax=Ferrovibrio sp. TaxID=1917215 RepID=UPI002639E569|nr:PDR/VanB family oxidoreductase [Ferrovibrio sp.]